MKTEQTVHAVEEEFQGADAEMAQRLTDLKGEPSLALLARVRTIPAGAPARRAAMPRVAWAAIATAVLVVCLAMASPSIQATLGVIQDAIGDVYLSITDRLSDDSDVVVLTRQEVSLAEARAMVPFPFSLPTTPPVGWMQSEQVQVGNFQGEMDVQVQWINPGHPSIYLNAFQPEEGLPISQLVGPESYQEMEIRGQPAVLVHGGWDSDTREWAHPDAKTILWAVDGVQYALWTSGSDLSDADLIAMAETIP